MVNMINDIEDNYSEYLNDTMGYQWDAWDALTQSDIADHDKILAGANPAEFDLKDLGQWAYCRRLLSSGNVETFVEQGQMLFDSNKQSESSALAYAEIAALVCNMMIKSNQLEEAERFLSARQAEHPSDVELVISKFILAATRKEDINAELQNVEDAELLFDLTEGLLSAGFPEEAKASFSVCKKKVGDQPLSAIHVDLASMERKLDSLRKEGI